MYNVATITAAAASNANQNNGWDDIVTHNTSAFLGNNSTPSTTSLSSNPGFWPSLHQQQQAVVAAVANAAASSSTTSSTHNNNGNSVSPNTKMFNSNHSNFCDNNSSNNNPLFYQQNMKNMFGWDPFPNYAQFSPASTSQISAPERPSAHLNSPVFPWMKMSGVNKGGDSKRTRQTYTRKQTLELEKEFHSNRYLTRKRRQEISNELDLTERQVKIWFQNRRMKHKKEVKDDGTGSNESVGNDSGAEESVHH
jgi:hypothetical protein